MSDGAGFCYRSLLYIQQQPKRIKMALLFQALLTPMYSTIAYKIRKPRTNWYARYITFCQDENRKQKKKNLRIGIFVNLIFWIVFTIDLFPPSLFLIVQEMVSLSIILLALFLIFLDLKFVRNYNFQNSGVVFGWVCCFGFAYRIFLASQVRMLHWLRLTKLLQMGYSINYQAFNGQTDFDPAVSLRLCTPV